MALSCVIVALILLLSADVLFLSLHLVYLQTSLSLIDDRGFWLEQERGYAEVFQYIKEYWTAMLMAWLALRCRQLHYIAWALLFLYFLADDSIQVHERIGFAIARRLELRHAFGLRAADFGELLVSGTIGALWLPLGLVTFIRAPSEVKGIGIRMVIIVSGLAAFGVVSDMLHQLTDKGGIASAVAGTIEDWGEMLVMSVGLSYVFSEALTRWSRCLRL